MKLLATVGISVLGVCAVAGLYALTRDAAPAAIPTEAQAATALAELYEARGDSDALCELGTSIGNCRALLQDAGTPPDEIPRVICAVEAAGNATHSGGLIVRIQTDNQAVDTESLLIETNGGARYMNPVYWNGAKVSEEGVAQIHDGYRCAQS